MSEEFEHALFIAHLFELHVCLKTLRIRILVRSLQQHPNVVDRASVSLTDVHDYARILLLLQSYLTAFLFGLQNYVGFGDNELLLVEIGGDLDHGGHIFDAIYRIGYVPVDVLLVVGNLVLTHVLIYNDLYARRRKTRRKEQEVRKWILVSKGVLNLK